MDIETREELLEKWIAALYEDEISFEEQDQLCTKFLKCAEEKGWEDWIRYLEAIMGYGLRPWPEVINSITKFIRWVEGNQADTEAWLFAHGFFVWVMLLGLKGVILMHVYIMIRF